MKLPNFEKAVVPKTKIVDYLLSFQHRDGRGKAAFFVGYGFSAENWDDLANGLRSHARDNDIAKLEQTPFGIRYVIEGPLRTPSGGTLRICSVWFIELHDPVPRFITAYPLKRRRR